MGSRLLFDNFEIDWERLSGPELARETSQSEPENPPTLPTLKAEHLTSVSALLSLHRDAVARGLVPESEHALLGFLSTAQSCLRRGQNPAAMFRWLIKRGLWNEATLGDEDLAHAARKRYLRSRCPSFLKERI